MNFKKGECDIFLDSGAFSAFTLNKKINILDYINFIKEYNVKTYSVLDVIGDAEETLKNQKIMEKKGLSPIPCFHYAEDIKYLLYYLKNYSYISLGGMVPVSTKNLITWLDKIFTEYICNTPNNLPRCKIHGFGMTTFDLIFRYPWYSIDSIKYLLAGKYGSVFVPKNIGGKYIYNQSPLIVLVSSISLKQKEQGKHILSFSEKERDKILKYFDYKKYKLGRSEFRFEKVGYQLKKNEIFFKRKGKERSTTEVYSKIEDGLSNNYLLRDRINIEYFIDLQRNLLKWPWAFKQRKKTFFN